MRKLHEPQTRVPGARRRVNPETHMAEHDRDGLPLWDMPAPIRYAEHTKWRMGKRIGESVQVPVYRGASASYVRWVKAQIRRQQRKQQEALALIEAMKVGEPDRLAQAEADLTDLVLNPGGYDVEAEDLAT